MTSGFVHEASTSNSVDWYTPAWVFDALDVQFDLDPCSPGLERTHVPAKHAYTIDDDGLAQPWFGDVWLNPPYGRGISDWLEKSAEHASKGGTVIALVPNRTDTSWFQNAALKADAMLMLSGRIKFHRGDKNAAPTGSPGTGSVFLAYGYWAKAALKNSGLTGVFAHRWEVKGGA